ncbi:MAG: DUF262 domain-containing protein [Opitutus sp.]|nr:DUF262 domain-containing protein [Opitutus sp.]
MAKIYSDSHEELHRLLSRASSENGATLLIPDLQRPYVWSPSQVVLLLDSLFRGWPFGPERVPKTGPGGMLVRSVG